MHEKWPHTAAVLAGGESRRMGRPKELLLLPDGRSMIETVAGVLGEVAPRVVVLGRTEALPDLVHLPDLRPGQGPLAGIEALLASGLDSEYLVCPCDLPRVSAEVLRELLAVPGAAAVLHVDGEEHFRPLPARFASTALGVVREALDADRRAVHRVIATLAPGVVELPAAAAAALVNVNTLAEYDGLL